MGTNVSVAVIGGGIIGCSAAAFLAERGADVTLFEASELGAGASGRNLGSVQHPYDGELEPIHLRTLAIYHEMARDGSLPFPASPVGVLLLAEDAAGLGRHATALAELAPMLRPEVLPAADVRRLEPALAPGLAAIRLATGYPVPPHAAVAAFATRAERAGAEIVLGSEARPAVAGGRCRGVVTPDGQERGFDVVLLAAGPWSPELLRDGIGPLPIQRTWGVTLQLELPAAPSHILEEEEIAGSEEPSSPPMDEGERVGGSFRWSIPTSPHAVFSLATASGRSALGSTFLLSEPNPQDLAGALMDRARQFLPGIERAAVVEVRRCARPQSVDGRPFIGRLEAEGLFVCAGHGPWGISTGPASAEMVVDEILGGESAPAALVARRATA